MRKNGLGWLVCLLVLGGCSGQNVVAGEEKTKAEQLQSSLPSWCSSICNRLAQCEVPEECDCMGDTCVCPPDIDEDCPAECNEELSRWAQGSDECAAAGERFKRCLDEAGCDLVSEAGICSFTEAEQAACPRPGNPDVDGGSSATGGPNQGTGGTTSDGPMAYGGTTYTAGSANYDGTAPSTCELGYGSGGGSSADGWPSLICEEGHEGCNDGHDYLMYCVRSSETVSSCTCLVDQQVVGGFDPGLVCPTSQQMNAGCGWNLDVE